MEGKKINKIKLISIYSICHFIVDFVCAIYILGQLPYITNSASEYIVSVIIYNFLAFAFQVPLGIILDKLKMYKYVSIIGMCMIGLCYLINIPNALLVASIVGIGNALYHLEGGVNAYSLSNKKAFLNGLFVAPGAMGIFLGTKFHNELIVTYLPIILIIISIILLIFNQKDEVNNRLEKLKKDNYSGLSLMIIVLLIGVSIIVRSIGGSAIVYSWKNSFILGLLYAISIVFGKAFGGLIADKLGLLKVAVISLVVSTVCLVLGHQIHFLAYIGIFMFNIPMAITLTILENTLSKRIACAVGLNTMFLFIGYLICYIDLTINNNIVLISSILLAIVSIVGAEKIYIKGGKINENI